MAETPSNALGAVAVGARFLLELGALAAVGTWGSRAAPGTAGLALGGACVVALAAAWGALVSPKAPWRLPDPWRLGAELLAFGLATAALALGDRPLVAAGYAGLALADEAVLVALDLR